MKKKIIWIVLILLVVCGIVAAWIFLGPATGFKENKEYLYISSKAATKEAVMDSLEKKDLVNNTGAFNFLAGRMGYWDNIKPGKYEINKGDGLLQIVRRLRNGVQSPVNLVITKIRTKEDLARMVGTRFECDSAEMIAFLNNPDSLRRYGNNAETALWSVLPDTYTYYWNTTPRKIYQKLYDEAEKFWTQERKNKAEKLGLTPQQAHVIASIIEEETNYQEEKDTMASVYINRYRRNMPLGADPTIKFALKNFSLKWIGGDMLNVVSPYNTYRNKGLPPGPICTPSRRTIEAVLAAPQTDYLFFVANSNFSGSHLFSVTFEEHMAKARAFQQEDKRRRELKNNQTNTR
jgi:UPF0755 protein